MKLYLLFFFLVASLSFGYFWLSSQNDINDKVDKMIIVPEKATSIPIPEPVGQIPKNPFKGEKADTTFNRIEGFAEIDWKFLAKVKFNEVYVDSIESYVPFPIFHPMVKSLEDKKVIIKGYVIPLSETGDEDLLILSANPYSSCFFCGQAGPESVMDIKIKTKIKHLKMDDKHTFRGRLTLNDSDLYYLNYILTDAELVE